MRYMIIVKMTEPSPPPSPEMLAAMGKLNQEMVEAGVLLGGEGLQPSKSGAKVKMEGGKLVVRDGPFTEAKELIGGFWIIKADSLEEAVGWVKKIPMWNEGEEVEVRRVSEVEDFIHDDISAEALDREKAQRESGAWPENR
ncbi:YciI family protein [Devosia sp. ZB163]|uniref:YciI family protein n=1 Tax=Devosia sp. ZB163 TaxID=3025938 RepID=UPI00236289E1|nr:YciI family protein [Devosia sp. ZB163]MDC9822532.1 YciI family protein [Devosia sp. ZB163]